MKLRLLLLVFVILILGKVRQCVLFFFIYILFLKVEIQENAYHACVLNLLGKLGSFYVAASFR